MTKQKWPFVEVMAEKHLANSTGKQRLDKHATNVSSGEWTRWRYASNPIYWPSKPKFCQLRDLYFFHWTSTSSATIRRGHCLRALSAIQMRDDLFAGTIPETEPRARL